MKVYVILITIVFLHSLRLTDMWSTTAEQRMCRDNFRLNADRLGTFTPTWSKCAFLCFLQFLYKILQTERNYFTMKKVGIVMGSDSDLPILQKSIDTLKALEIPFEVHVYSAHRTPDEARDFTRSARERGFGVIIAAAGMAAHLAGAVAANTTLPVIGIPCKSSNLDGLDALLSTVMMPSGIPVATVAINGGVNAALLAAQMLAIADDELAAKLDAKRKSDAEAVLKKDAAISEQFNA